MFYPKCGFYKNYAFKFMKLKKAEKNLKMER